MLKTTSILGIMSSFLYVSSSQCSRLDELVNPEYGQDGDQRGQRKCLSSDPILIPSNAHVQEEEKDQKKPQKMSRSCSPTGNPNIRVQTKDKHLVLNPEISRGEEIRRMSQQDSRVHPIHQEGRSWGNDSHSLGGSSPRDKSKKLHSPKSSIASSPRNTAEEYCRRRISDSKVTETNTPLIIPIKIEFPFKNTTHFPQVVVQIPQTSVPTSIVLSFDMQASQKRDDSSFKRVTDKKKLRSAKSSPRSLQVEEELDRGIPQEKCDLELQENSVFGGLSGQTVSLWDGEMLDQMICHTKKHHLLFSEHALKKTETFLQKLEYFVNLQMLLRADNQYMFEYLKELNRDYSILAQISDSEIEEKQKTDLLIGISHCHNNICVSANKDEKSRYQNQHDAIDIILCEYVELHENTKENFSKIENLNPKLIRENAQTISMVHNFVLEHFSMLKNIELERSDFLHFLDIFFGNVKREIKIESALEGFPNLIERHEHAAQQREKLTLSNLVLDAGELKATLSEKVSLLKKSDAASSHHDSSSDDGKKHKRGLTPPRNESDISSQKK